MFDLHTCSRLQSALLCWALAAALALKRPEIPQLEDVISDDDRRRGSFYGALRIPIRCESNQIPGIDPLLTSWRWVIPTTATDPNLRLKRHIQQWPLKSGKGSLAISGKLTDRRMIAISLRCVLGIWFRSLVRFVFQSFERTYFQIINLSLGHFCNPEFQDCLITLIYEVM